MNVTRRTVATGAAWSIPVVVIASAAPAYAASSTATCGSASGTSLTVASSYIPTVFLGVDLYVVITQDGVVVATDQLGSSTADVNGYSHTFTGLPVGGPYTVFITSALVAIGSSAVNLAPANLTWPDNTVFNGYCTIGTGSVTGSQLVPDAGSGCGSVDIGGYSGSVTCYA